MGQVGRRANAITMRRVAAYTAAVESGAARYGIATRDRSAAQMAAIHLGLKNDQSIIDALRSIRHVDIVSTTGRRASAKLAVAKPSKAVPLSLAKMRMNRMRARATREARAQPQSWFVVVTNPQGEVKASVSLTDAGYETYLPTIRIMVKKGREGGRELVSRPLFPGYMFLANQGKIIFQEIEACDGVGKVLRFNGVHALVSGGAVDAIAKAELSGNFDGKTKTAKYSIGQTVKLTSGPFASFDMVIKKIEDDQFVQGMLWIFGREMTVRFDTQKGMLA